MTHDIDVLTHIIEACLYVAAFFATAFPILYLFSPWYSTKLGRLLMGQSVAFALALDMTALFTFWTPNNLLVFFWIEAIIFSLIAVTSAGMTWGLWRTNHSKWAIHQSEQKD